VINDDQVAVLQLQSVDTRDCPVAQLSLCPGVLETEVLGVLSLKNFVEVLIEKAEENVVYRSRKCSLLYNEKLGRVCESCSHLFQNLLNFYELEKNPFQEFTEEDTVKLDPHDDDDDCDSDPELDMKKRINKSVTISKYQIQKSKDEKIYSKDSRKKRASKNNGVEFDPHEQNETSGDLNLETKKSKVNNSDSDWNPHDDDDDDQSDEDDQDLLEYSKKQSCPFCPEEFTRNKLISHLKYLHLEKRENPIFKDLVSSLSSVLVCSSCGKKFRNNQSLEKHMTDAHGTHVNSKPCNICGKYFKTKNTLQNHVRKVHNHEHPHKLCAFCGENVMSQNFTVHIQQFHSDEEFPCLECGKTFNTRKAQKKHINRVHVKEKTMECPKCERTFIFNFELQKHISQVHDKLKPFYCEVCEFKCANLSNLNLHRRKSHNKPKWTKAMLSDMIENDQHPYYTKNDLSMIKSCKI